MWAGGSWERWVCQLPVSLASSKESRLTTWAHWLPHFLKQLLAADTPATQWLRVVPLGKRTTGHLLHILSQPCPLPPQWGAPPDQPVREEAQAPRRPETRREVWGAVAETPARPRCPMTGGVERLTPRGLGKERPSCWVSILVQQKCPLAIHASEGATL